MHILLVFNSRLAEELKAQTSRIKRRRCSAYAPKQVIMTTLRVYGTVFNNANRVELSLKSIAQLKPAKIYVADNMSTDGTTELLKKHKEVVLITEKCNRGKGKRLALERLLEDAEPSDAVIMIDLDTVYKKPYHELVKEKMKVLKNDEIYAEIGQLETAKTAQKLFWRDMNNSEDIERFARAISIGITIYRLDVGSGLENKYYQNEVGIKGLREARYAKGKLALYLRLFNETVGVERDEAYKSFKEFHSSFKSFSSPVYLPIFALSYLIAKIQGIYSYDPKLNNIEYVRHNEVKI